MDTFRNWARVDTTTDETNDNNNASNADGNTVARPLTCSDVNHIRVASINAPATVMTDDRTQTVTVTLASAPTASDVA